MVTFHYTTRNVIPYYPSSIRTLPSVPEFHPALRDILFFGCKYKSFLRLCNTFPVVREYLRYCYLPVVLKAFPSRTLSLGQPS